MKEILHNLALLDAINFCKENNINIAGTHLVKYPRKFIYNLVRDSDNIVLVTIFYYKNRTPLRVINKNQ